MAFYWAGWFWERFEESLVQPVNASALAMPVHLQAWVRFSSEGCQSYFHKVMSTRADEACGGGQAGSAWAMGGQDFGIILMSRLYLVSLGKAALQLVASSGFYWLNNRQSGNLASCPCLHPHVNVVTVFCCVQHLVHTSLSLSQSPGFDYIF